MIVYLFIIIEKKIYIYIYIYIQKHSEIHVLLSIKKKKTFLFECSWITSRKSLTGPTRRRVFLRTPSLSDGTSAYSYPRMLQLYKDGITHRGAVYLLTISLERYTTRCIFAELVFHEALVREYVAAYLASRRGSRDSQCSNVSNVTNEDVGPLNFSNHPRGRQRRTSNFLELPGEYICNYYIYVAAWFNWKARVFWKFRSQSKDCDEL